jgi:hypothetical protein
MKAQKPELLVRNSNYRHVMAMLPGSSLFRKRSCCDVDCLTFVVVNRGTKKCVIAHSVGIFGRQEPTLPSFGRVSARMWPTEGPPIPIKVGWYVEGRWLESYRSMVRLRMGASPLS